LSPQRRRTRREKATISKDRLRLGALVDEDPRRNPWVHIFGRRRYALMAAKKKAAKKPAKKAAKKSAKKK
jgi:hypothetical protein